MGHIHDKEEVAEILKQIPEVSVVIAGHTHEAYPEMMNVEGPGRGARETAMRTNSAAWICRWTSPAGSCGRRSGRRSPIEAKLAPAPDVERLVNHWESKVRPLVDVPIP